MAIKSSMKDPCGDGHVLHLAYIHVSNLVVLLYYSSSSCQSVRGRGQDKGYLGSFYSIAYKCVSICDYLKFKNLLESTLKCVD